MASAIDDLRYISRYGYRDPWAEATKSIADNLLAYSQSKNKRDILIAQYQEKQLDREDRDRKELKADNRYTFNQFENPEDALAWGREDNQRFMDVFGAGGMTSGVTGLEKQVGVNTQLRSYEDIAKDPKSTFLQIKDALTEARILATQNKLSGKSSAYGLQIQQHQNRFVQDSNRELLTEFANTGYDAVTDKGTWLTKAEHTSVMADISEGRIPQAQTTLNRLFSQKGTDLSYIESSYNKYLKSYDDAFKDEDGMWMDAMAESNYKLLRASLDSRFMGLLPTKYQDKTKPVQRNIEEARLRVDPDKSKQQNQLRLENQNKLLNQKKVSALAPNKIFNIATPDEVTDYSNFQNVTVLNKFTGKEQVMSGAQITQMGPNNVEVLKDNKANKNAYIELSRDYHSGLEAFVVSAKSPKDGSSTLVRNGMTVMDKSTGKRFSVGVKEVEPQKRPPVYSAMAEAMNKYKYIVNGKEYGYSKFIEKFGVPYYEEVKVDSAVSRPTVTGFSRHEVTK